MSVGVAVGASIGWALLQANLFHLAALRDRIGVPGVWLAFSAAWVVLTWARMRLPVTEDWWIPHLGYGVWRNPGLVWLGGFGGEAALEGAVLLGGALQAAAFGWVMMVIKSEGSDLSGWSLTPALTVAGIGMMVLIMPQTSIALDTVPTSEAGAASGTFTTFGQVGMVLGVALAGAVYFGEISDTSDAQAAVTAGLGVIIAAYALAGIAALTMPSLHIGSKEDGET